VIRGARARARALTATRTALAAELGREPTTVEIAARLGWSVSRLGQVETEGAGPVSLDFEGEDGRAVVETLVDETAARPGKEAEVGDLRSALLASTTSPPGSASLASAPASCARPASAACAKIFPCSPFGRACSRPDPRLFSLFHPCNFDSRS
jgi:hypothetical protein